MSVTEFLLADIGGTTSRFALAAPDGRPQHIVTIANDTASGAEDAIGRALDKLGARPRGAILAVAGPVAGDEIALTNRDWTFTLSRVRAQFGFERVNALNDFAAVAWAVPALKAGDLTMIGASTLATGVKAVLGPGTGLGVAALVETGSGVDVVSSEGGHVVFGPALPDEDAVFARLRADGGRMSAESILSGPGLARLHRALHPDTMKIKSEMILTQARAGGREARATVSLFVRLLGRFAGDVALTFNASGGVYLAGGVALALGALLDEKIFRTSFEAHSPHDAMLAKTPVALMTCAEPGLIGCGVVASRVV